MLEENLYKTGQFMMKLLRNWLSHSKFSSDISESEVAYFFMLGIRSLLKLDSHEICFHELILSDVFNSFPLEEIKKDDMVIRKCLDACQRRTGRSIGLNNEEREDTAKAYEKENKGHDQGVSGVFFHGRFNRVHIEPDKHDEILIGSVEFQV